MGAYGEAIAQGCALGGGRMLANRSSQRTAGDAGLDSVDGALRTEALVEAQREPSGCHGRKWCGGGGRIVKLMIRSRRLRCCAVVKLQMFSHCRELPPRKDRFACRPITCARLFSRRPDYAEVAYTHYSQRHLSVTSTTLAPPRRPHHRSHHGLHSPPHAPPPGARRPRQARLHLRRPSRQSAAAAIVPEAVMDSPASRFPDLRQQTDPPTAAAGHQGHRQ